MALTRVWTPSGNYSGGSSKRLIVIHTMEGFTGPKGAEDCALYFKGDVGASSQVCIDNYHPGKLWECVSRANSSWTQCGYNSVSVSAEQAGYASYSRAKWLDEQATLLHVVAQWIAEEAAHLGIPIRALSASEAQGGAAGVTYHSRLGPDGCGHSDPGDGYPLDVVLDWAKGGAGPAPAGGGDMSVGVATDPDGNQHYVCIGKDDGALYYFPPGWANWGRVDPSQGGAQSGAGITITDDWWVTLTYTNGSSKPCEYRKKFRVGEWAWRGVGDINAR